MSQDIYIVGAGGIGCAVGQALCSAGVPVTFVDADEAKVEWGKKHGVQVDDWPSCSARFLTFAEWTPQAGATILLCTKCYDNPAVLGKLPSSVHLIPIQNGFDPEMLAHQPSFEGIASFVSECCPHRPHTRITRKGRLHFGAVGRAAPRCELFHQLRGSPLFRVEMVDDILPYKYTKLMYNAAISPLAASAGLDNGQLLWVPKARRLFFQLLRENFAILRSAGIRLARIGPFRPVNVDRILRCRPLANAFAWAFYPTLRQTYCSMSGDLPRGRTEIDYYNRHLIDIAGGHPCPLNRRVYEMVKRMERERIKPHVEVLDELAGGEALAPCVGHSTGD